MIRQPYSEVYSVLGQFWVLMWWTHNTRSLTLWWQVSHGSFTSKLSHPFSHRLPLLCVRADGPATFSCNFLDNCPRKDLKSNRKEKASAVPSFTFCALLPADLKLLMRAASAGCTQQASSEDLAFPHNRSDQEGNQDSRSVAFFFF